MYYVIIEALTTAHKDKVSMTKETAREEGIDRGYSFCTQNAGEWERLKDLAVVDELTTETLVQEEEMREDELFKPFAEQLNNSGDPAGYWKAYEEGVHSGIKQAITDMRRKG